MAGARYSTLLSVSFLKNLLRSKPPNHRILDASWHLPNSGRDAKAEYFQQHIPGAAFFDIDKCADKNTPLPHMVPSLELFEEYASHLGINNDTQLIVYDNSPQFPLFSAQRVWWIFRLFGHNKISLLEGGLPQWLAEDGEVTDRVPTIQRQSFKGLFNPGLIKYYEDIEENVSKGEFTVLDARPAGRFQGTAPEPRPDNKSGCIPGSKNIPFAAMMNEEDRKVKSSDELKALFDQTGVDLNKPVAALCGTGVTACTIALAAHLCGKDDVAVYDGSWVEWDHRAPPQLKMNVPEE